MQTTSERSYVGFMPRLIAYLIDLLCVTIASGVVLGIFGVLEELGIDKVNENILFQYSIAAICAYIVKKLYFVVLISNCGQTLGKMCFRIKVVNSDGSKVSFFNALYRETIGRFLSEVFSYLGYFGILVDKQKRAAHDWLCDTVVIYDSNINNEIQNKKMVYTPINNRNYTVNNATMNDSQNNMANNATMNNGQNNMVNNAAMNNSQSNMTNNTIGGFVPVSVPHTDTAGIVTPIMEDENSIDYNIDNHTITEEINPIMEDIKKHYVQENTEEHLDIKLEEVADVSLSESSISNIKPELKSQENVQDIPIELEQNNLEQGVQIKLEQQVEEMQPNIINDTVSEDSSEIDNDIVLDNEDESSSNIEDYKNEVDYDTEFTFEDDTTDSDYNTKELDDLLEKLNAEDNK